MGCGWCAGALLAMCLSLQEQEQAAQIEQAEKVLLELPQVECELKHRFAPGVYMREVLMPAGSFIIGHCHKTGHLNIITEGSARVMMDGVVHEIKAPCVFTSTVGVRKILYIRETCRWATIHPTNETEMDKLEAELIVKSQSFLEHCQKDLNALKDSLKEEVACLG